MLLDGRLKTAHGKIVNREKVIAHLKQDLDLSKTKRTFFMSRDT